MQLLTPQGLINHDLTSKDVGIPFLETLAFARKTTKPEQSSQAVFGRCGRWG